MKYSFGHQIFHGAVLPSAFNGEMNTLYLKQNHVYLSGEISCDFETMQFNYMHLLDLLNGEQKISAFSLTFIF